MQSQVNIVMNQTNQNERDIIQVKETINKIERKEKNSGLICDYIEIDARQKSMRFYFFYFIILK